MDAPTAWLIDHAALLPRVGRGLDLASGRGRHALWLAERGLSVTAIDRDSVALAELLLISTQRALMIETMVADLEQERAPLDRHTFDVIVVVHYLHRRLFPALLEALRPGGLLVYETFTRAQAALGKPTNPDFLLEPGELLRLVHPLDVLDSREGYFAGRHVTSVVARSGVTPSALQSARDVHGGDRPRFNRA